ncbi:MBL fold metallo-hydrolase [Enterovibrio makurazakiensis]|uniref:MBL fold metallo-hydrolase n=1 Tax=Enterovibrio gelatinilyticus TaxID=2899819 RepID=A0ABT5R2R0_9GAMM|nr:MBL fold metallo-hydrolase [Enterovibrio sp. ZSDZ42]MDD1794554.1 MBL fold metallo-hydrolase [Enterovibrio sp. ZSDZ42]
MKKTMIAASIVATTSLFGFTANANEPVWDANKVQLIAEKLDNGVYAYYPSDAKELEVKGLPVATSGGFIVGDKGVLIIDTMLNERLNKQVQGMVEKEANKPIIYAVNTSFHGDHSYGNMYLPKDTKIIQHEVAQDYIDNHFEHDTQFMMHNFGKGRGIEDIVPTDADILVGAGGNITLDLGGKLVEIIDFGFAQTGGDLFVWEPQSKTMWSGNPIITVKPSLPWLLDGHLVETLASLKKVRAFLPDDATVVPGHGSPMTPDDIQWHIDYLDTIKTQVQAAIDEGLTLEETVAKVQMPEFRGYALRDWVHPALNVPAAYKDLSATK